MFIIVEGPDNSGKTTLVHKLAERARLSVTHSGGPVKDVEELHLRLRLLDMSSSGNDIIFDRFPLISEQVYGPILRGVDYVEDDLARALLKGSVIIYCRPPLSRLVDFSSHEGKTNYLSPDLLIKLRELQPGLVKEYDRLMSDFNPIIYDYTVDSERYINLIARYIRSRLDERRPR